MKDQFKTKQMLIQELISLRHRISDLERSESELKWEKEVLKDSESKFQFLAENMADVVFAVDLNLMTTYVSPSIERLLGFTPQERMTQKADQQLTLKSQKLVLEALSEELSKEKEKGSDPNRSKTLELEYYHKDGSIKHLLTYIRGIRDMEGNLTGFYGSCHDITERKRAEESFSREYSFRNAIINNVSEGLCVCHESAEYPFVKFTIWNARMTEITGYTMEQINRLGWYQSVYPDPELQAKAIERMKSMRKKDDLRSEEWEITCADGNKRVLNISTSIVESDDCVVHVLALMQDITERKLAREALRISETRYRLLAENARDIIWTVDMNMRLTYVSPSGTRLLGFTEEEMMARTMEEAFSQTSVKKAMQIFAEEMEIENAGCGDPNRSRILELELIRKDGNSITVEGNFCFLRDSTEKAIGILSILRDITERKRLEEEILALTITDQLTGLHNRRGFLSLAEQQLKLSNRNKNGMLLFFADLDLLKWINDTMGHEEGDKALIEAANIFKETFRTSDIIARLGGDEYAALVVDVPETNSEVIIARLQFLTDIRNNQENRKYRLSISIGCSYYDPEHPCTIDDLIVRADKLMYEQKQKKKSLLTKNGLYLYK
jgi:diguanylate cyclase (GGDEF)-like protein/PAS domain S-box-containing protein